MISNFQLWLVISGLIAEHLVGRDVIVGVEGTIRDVDFFGRVGSRLSWTKRALLRPLRQKLLRANTSQLLKAIGQLGAKTPATQLKGAKTLSNLGVRTDTIPMIIPNAK